MHQVTLFFLWLCSGSSEDNVIRTNVVVLHCIPPCYHVYSYAYVVADVYSLGYVASKNVP